MPTSTIRKGCAVVTSSFPEPEREPEFELSDIWTPYFYTFGYHGRKLSDLAAILANNPDMVVLDCRLKPWSRTPEWNYSNLLETLRRQYAWFGAWGNLNYKAPKKGIAIRDFEKGLGYFHALKNTDGRLWNRVLLMCACKHESKCHRHVLAELLAEREQFVAGEFPFDQFLAEEPDPCETLLNFDELWDRR